MALLRGIAPSLLGISAAALLLLAGRAPAPPAALATVLLSLLSHIAVLRMCSYSSYPSSSAALLTGTAQRLAPFACLRLVLVGLLLHPTLDQSAGTPSTPSTPSTPDLTTRRVAALAGRTSAR